MKSTFACKSVLLEFGSSSVILCSSRIPTRTQMNFLTIKIYPSTNTLINLVRLAAHHFKASIAECYSKSWMIRNASVIIYCSSDIKSLIYYCILFDTSSLLIYIIYFAVLKYPILKSMSIMALYSCCSCKQVISYYLVIVLYILLQCLLFKRLQVG